MSYKTVGIVFFLTTQVIVLLKRLMVEEVGDFWSDYTYRNNSYLERSVFILVLVFIL